MPRTSERRRFIRELRRRLGQRKSLLVAQMLCEDEDDNISSSNSGSHSHSSSSSNDSDSSAGTTDGLIFMAAYESTNSRLNFAEMKRYLFPRGKYRKFNDHIFVRDLNGEGERPWFTDEEFKQKYRVSREALDHIYEKVKDHKVFKNKRGPRQLHPKYQLMVLLDYLGTEGSGANNPRQRSYFQIGRGTAHNARKRARKAIKSLGPEYYYWPDEDERKKISEQYRKKFNLPNCVGVIDGTLFPLLFSPQTADAADYHGRKFQWSLTCVVVSDDKRRIRWYVTGYPGSTHDNRMWRKSPLKMKKNQYFVMYEYIIGDTAFDPSENMVSAYKANPGFVEPEDPDECNFNGIISEPRVSSEHVNGMWKGRFPWLRNIPNLIKGKKSLRAVLRYIHCTVILHNLLIEYGDEHMPSWKKKEDEVSDIAEPSIEEEDDDDNNKEMLPEEKMLYEDVPVNAPKDWRRETVKEYLRETHDLFREERNARGYDDDSDVDMEYYYAIDEKHEEYFNRFKNTN